VPRALLSADLVRLMADLEIDEAPRHTRRLLLGMDQTFVSGRQV